MIDPTHSINDTVHVPEEGTHKYRDFWGAYKGHVLGLMRGTLSGGLLGALMGGAFVGLALLAGMTLAAPLAVVAGFSVLGIFVGGDIMGRAGYSAGVAAADKAEMELRMRYPGSGTGIVRDPLNPPMGEGHHYEVPPERDEGKWYHWQTGLPMTVLGLGVGALAAFAFTGLVGPLIAAAGAAKGVLAVGAAAKVATAGSMIAEHGVVHLIAEHGIGLASSLLPFMGGTLGFSYGVNRARFKDVFNPIDRVLDGGLIRSRAKTLELESYQQELTPEAEHGKNHPTINTLQRQEEGHRLFYDYFERSFWRATRDSIKGSLDGGLVGGLLGVTMGALSFLIPPLIPFAPVITALVAGLGAHEGMKIFTEAGMRSGATSTATDLLEVKRQRLLKGLDPEMDMPDGRGKDTRFNIKRALFGAAIGLVVGAAMFSVMGPLVALTGLGVTAGSGLAAMATGLLGTAGVPLLAGGIAGMLAGAVAGVSSRTLKSMAGLADSIYEGRILKGDIFHHTQEPCRLPYLAPNSPWLPTEGTAQDRATELTTTVLQPKPYQPGMVQAAPEPDAAIAPEPSPRPAQPDYPVSAPMAQRVQHLIREREQNNASAMQREDERKVKREAQTSVVIGV